MIDFEKSILEKIPTIKKFAGLVYEATFGLVKQYQEKTMELAKIRAAAYYVQAMKGLRKHLMAMAAILFSLLLFAVSLVVFPVALMMIAPWELKAKIVSISALGVFYLLITAWVMASIFSEKRWLEWTRSQEWLDNFVKNK